MDSSTKAIVQTIIYSDLFDFPLRKSELWYFLKSRTEVSQKDFLRALRFLPSYIAVQKGFYYLSGRKNILSKRNSRAYYSKGKFSLGKRAASLLSLIPTISYIGISGSVAYGNAESADDIDFFIVVKKNTIWMSRLLCLLLLQVFGLRRKRTAQNEKNKVCINMMLSEDHLDLPKERHDIYTAHELAQLMPIFYRNDMHKKILIANSWVRKFMPNVLRKASSRKYPKIRRQLFFTHFLRRLCNEALSPLLNILSETISRNIQMKSIKKHTTNETISDILLAFHPYDYRQYVLARYKKQLIVYKLLKY